AWIEDLERRIAEDRRIAERQGADLDRPLAPGSGAPSLAGRIAAITGRVAPEEDEDDEPVPDRARADYIAAARRAAQAAASDESAGRPVASHPVAVPLPKPRRAPFAGLFTGRTKWLTLALIILAIAFAAAAATGL